MVYNLNKFVSQYMYYRLIYIFKCSEIIMISFLYFNGKSYFEEDQKIVCLAIILSFMFNLTLIILVKIYYS